MDPLTIAAIASVAAPVISGAIGGGQANKQRKAGQKILDKAADQVYGLEVPDIADLQFDPTLAQYAGDIDPALLSNMQDIESNYGQITTDPRFAQAQYQSLGGLDELIAGGGMTAADKLAYQNATNDAAMQASREQGNIARDMAERGLSGGGNELAMRLASSQGAANRGAEAAQTQVATAQQRALDALLQRGQMGGQMEQADFNRQSEAARAKDQIAQFNRNNAMETQRTNVGATNNMNIGNRDARQANINTNTVISNTGKQNNVDAVQRNFGNQMEKAVAGGNIASGQAANRSAVADSTANMWDTIGQAGSAGAAAYYDYNKPKTDKPKV